MTKYFIAEVAQQDSGRPGLDREVKVMPVRVIKATWPFTQHALNEALTTWVPSRA
jgi:hypothetical protein